MSVTLIRPAIVLLLFLLGAGCGPQAGEATKSPPSPSIQVIDTVIMREDDATLPPDDVGGWQTLQLPLSSRTGDEAHSNRVIWLRFDLQRPQATSLYSLYFYRYNLSLDVYFNGEHIGGDSYRENRQTVAWNHPRLVDIQNANWHEGQNTVYVRFVGSYFGGLFGEVLFGPRAILQPLYEERLFRQVRVNEWLQASGIVLTLLALTLWIVRRQDSVYLLFAGATGCWLVLTTHMVVYYNLLDYRYWLPLVHAAIDLFILFLFLFVTRFASLASPRAEKWLLGWTTFALTWHTVAPITVWWVGAYLIHAVGNLFIVAVVMRLSLRAIRSHEPIALAIVLTVLAQFGFGLHDFIQTMTADREDWESAIYLSQFAFPLLLLVFTIGLLQRFTAALNLAEDLNRNLEAKVAASHQTIEQSFREMQALELSKAAEQERLRIYRDLHDDVGSKLLSIVHAGQDGKLVDLARAALKSLRDAVSRANSPEQPLAEFLAQLHEESLLRLSGTGHTLHWEQPPRLPDCIISSESVFNISQIVRESISNIIRHANASEVCIRITLRDAGWTISIADNGRGMGTDCSEGNGLVHIRQRADELSARVAWNSDAGRGLCVELNLPAPHG